MPPAAEAPLMPGPLAGFSVIEIAGIGPGPFCAMMLADMGADVLRVQRPARRSAIKPNPVAGRGMRQIEMDLKNPRERATVLDLIDKADAMIEGFRPGVAERLGIGPEPCLARNPKLIYGRMTGWGQNGPLAARAGHDINYIAISGALAAIGTEETGPVPPLNLVGDFGGGGLMLAFGIVCALLERSLSRQGQVVDAAMSDGAALLMATTYGQYAAGRWTLQRNNNLLDGGAHFYGTYRCSDGKWIALGAIEPQFYASLLDLLHLDRSEFEPQHDCSKWRQWKERFAAIFLTRTQDEWCELAEEVDVCLSPVLNMADAIAHPHNIARGTFVNYEGTIQPAPAPRFSRTSPKLMARRPLGA